MRCRADLTRYDRVTLLLCPDCATPMTLLPESTPTRVVYLCPARYPDDPRLAKS